MNDYDIKLRELNNEILLDIENCINTDLKDYAEEENHIWEQLKIKCPKLEMAAGDLYTLIKAIKEIKHNV